MTTSRRSVTFSSGAAALICLVGILIGWIARGVLQPTVPVTAQKELPPPVPQSVSPLRGSGPSQTFMVTVSAPQGYTAIHSVGVLINDIIMASHSCYPQYDVSTGDLNLIADSGNSVLSAPAHSGAKLENSQCMLDSAAITAHGEGNKVTISLPITFKPAFAGPKSVFVIATNGAGKSSDLGLLSWWMVSSF